MTTLSQQITVDENDGTDDGAEYFSDSGLGAGSSFGNSYTGAALFASVAIPQGAEVISASLTLYATVGFGSSDFGPVTAVTAYGIAEDDCAAFTASLPSTRILTSASAAVPHAKTVDATPCVANVTAIVQEIINRTGFSSGHKIGFVIKASGSDDYSALYYDYSLNPAFAPTLSITIPGGSSYTLVAANGSGVLTGRAANLRLGRKLASAKAAFSASGQVAIPRVGRKLSVAPGGFAIIAQNADFTTPRKLNAGSETFALGGRSTALRCGHRLVAIAGGIGVPSQEVSLRRGHSLAAAASVFGLEGQAAGLRRKLNLDALVSGLSWAGPAVSPRAGHRIAGAVRNLDCSGPPVQLRCARRLVSASGTANLSGAVAGVVRGRPMLAVSRAFALTGRDGGLKVMRSLPAGARSISMSGQAARLRWFHWARIEPADDPGWNRVEASSVTWSPA